MTEGGDDGAEAQTRFVFLPKHNAAAAWNELQRVLQVGEPDETSADESDDVSQSTPSDIKPRRDE